MRQLSSFLVAVGVLLSAASIASSAEPAKDAVLLTEQSLDSLATFEYVDTPLSDVLKQQGEVFGVKIEIAKAKPGEKAIDPETLVTCNLKQISLRSSLRILLDRQGLDFVVKPDGVISIVPATAELKAKHVESKVQAKAHAKLREILQQRTTLEFVDCPLKDVIAFLADQHDCTISFSGPAGKREVVDEPTTASLTKLTLQEALKRMLLRRDLQVVVQNEVLQIVPWTDPADAKPSPEVAKALEKKFNIDLEQPLPVIAHDLTILTGTPVLTHLPALKAAGIDLKRPVTLKAQGVTAAEALAQIKPALPLKLLERDGLVLISAEKDATRDAVKQK